MINSITGNSMDTIYPALLLTLLQDGEQVHIGRVNTLTREIVGMRLILTDVRNNIYVHPVRNLNYRFMLAEWLWIMAGRNDVKTVARFNSQIAKFSDNGEIFAGAYGPRLQPQWEYVIGNLRKDPSSRQAVSTIWDRNPLPSKDIPCTISCQFLIREKKMHGIFNMRSSDAWLGIPYDVFNFSQIINGMAGELVVEPGSLILNLGSSHLYSNNFSEAHEVGTTAHRGGALRSPLLPRTGQGSVDDILDNNPVVHGAPWDTYKRALHSKDRQECYQILKEMSL